MKATGANSPMHSTISVESKPAHEGQKSRTFSVELLAWVLANEMWELGSTSKETTHRPVFLAYAGSSSAPATSS